MFKEYFAGSIKIASCTANILVVSQERFSYYRGTVLFNSLPCCNDESIIQYPWHVADQMEENENDRRFEEV